MEAQTFLRTVTMDKAGLLEELLGRLETGGVPYCVIGGQGVNAYADPLVSLGLDLVIAASQLERFLTQLPAGFRCSGDAAVVVGTSGIRSGDAG